VDATEHDRITPELREQASRAKRNRREQARTAVLVVLAIVVTIFAVLNLTTVSVDWILGTSKVPLIVVIVVSLVAGILICYTAEHRRGRRR
jgi:uncharacterized integral membrane protein